MHRLKLNAATCIYGVPVVVKCLVLNVGTMMLVMEGSEDSQFSMMLLFFQIPHFDCLCIFLGPWYNRTTNIVLGSNFQPQTAALEQY